MIRAGIILFFVPLLVLGATSVPAEIVHLKNGKSVEGKILSEDKKSIQIDLGVQTPLTYFRDEIETISPSPPPAPAIIDNAQVILKADALESKAVTLIDQGNADEGLQLMAKAIKLDPSGQRMMNYASILFGNGVELFKKGQQEDSFKVLLKAKQTLEDAIGHFDQEKDAPLIAQCDFLLGEIYRHAFNDVDLSTKHYQKAIVLSGHEGAKAALAN